MAHGDQQHDLLKQLNAYRLTTAEILYRLPDHPVILQSYIWQEYDLAPRFPELRKFLDFWQRELDGKLFGVKIASCPLITVSELRHHSGEIYLH